VTDKDRWQEGVEEEKKEMLREERRRVQERPICKFLSRPKV